MSAKVYFISLGCDKNRVDSEVMIGELGQAGYGVTDDIDDADAVVINTCCFIGDARDESINTILEIADLKKQGMLRAIVVTGCLAQRYRDDVMEEIPEVDAVLGTASAYMITKALREALEGSRMSAYDPLDAPLHLSDVRNNTSAMHYAYMKIAEGCDKRCTYCIIPSLRGPYRSVPIEHLMDEARRLSAQGVSELILVAQETSVYGTDLYGKKSLPRLLHELASIEGIRWIRILYCYPEEIDDELIEAIATEPKVCHYLDMPIQHASDPILRAMGRRTTQDGLRLVIGRLRDRIPDIVLRTTLISGFPGETREDFEELYRFVNEMEFDRLGVFTYSREEGTVAADMPDQIPEEEATARRDELMELQQAVAFDNTERQIGRILEVVIDGTIPEEDVFAGRSYMDAPEDDGYVFMPIDRTRMSGDVVRVRIDGARGYDLTGVIIEEEG